jgi:hypothetical protein
MFILDDRVLRIIKGEAAACGTKRGVFRVAGCRSRVDAGVVDLETRLDPAKRTEVVKMVPDWCENLQFVRFSPHLPASSAFARFILRRGVFRIHESSGMRRLQAAGSVRRRFWCVTVWACLESTDR